MSWFKPYISSRKQFVEVSSIQSNLNNVASADPKEGHLSLMLFSLFINNLKMLFVTVVFFCLLIIWKYNWKLQDDLNAVTNRVTQMGLEFNISKCHSMSYYRMRIPIVFTYSMHSIFSVPSGNSVLDVGILFNRKLNFHSLIESSCCKSLNIFWVC